MLIHFPAGYWSLKMTQIKDNVFYNPKESRKIIKILCCLDYIQEPNIMKWLNIFYICFVYVLQMIVILQTIIHACITEDVSKKVEAVHYGLVILIISGYIANELYNYDRLIEAWKLLQYAYENFNGCVITEEQKKVHRKNAKVVHTLNRLFSALMSGACLAYLFFSPIKELIYENEDTPRSLPIPMYMPFNATRVWVVTVT